MSDDDSKLVIELSAAKRLSVRKFKGRMLIDIREFYTKDGQQLPGKKGISLTKEQFAELIAHLPEITKAAELPTYPSSKSPSSSESSESSPASPKESSKRDHSSIETKEENDDEMRRKQIPKVEKQPDITAAKVKDEES